MNEHLRKGIVFGSLIMAIAWGMYNFLPQRDSFPQKQVPAVESAAPAAAQLATIEKSINIAEMKNKKWGQDPFRAVNKSTGYQANNDEPRWKVSGIVYNSLKPLAIINGNSVSVGDRIGKATVVKIMQKSVVLDYGGSKVTLRVQKG